MPKVQCEMGEESARVADEYGHKEMRKNSVHVAASTWESGRKLS